MDGSVLAFGVWQDVMVYGFRSLFFLSAVLLMVIVLLQEGKGGGLASALGGQGAETFGVSSGGVNKVTLFLAGLFLVSALGHALSFEQGVTHRLRKESQDRPVQKDQPLEDVDEGGDGAGGEGGGKAPPPPEKAPPKDAGTETPK